MMVVVPKDEIRKEKIYDLFRGKKHWIENNEKIIQTPTFCTRLKTVDDNTPPYIYIHTHIRINAFIY